jgi:hypothetical protein
VHSSWTFNGLTGVFSDLESGLAEGIAKGDVCPISRLPMVDINPSFVPRAIKKPLPRVSLSPRKSRTAKGKMRESLPSGGILDFFGKYSHPGGFVSIYVMSICRPKSCNPKTEGVKVHLASETEYDWQGQWKTYSSRCHGQRSRKKEETT